MNFQNRPTTTGDSIIGSSRRPDVVGDAPAGATAAFGAVWVANDGAGTLAIAVPAP